MARDHDVQTRTREPRGSYEATPILQPHQPEGVRHLAVYRCGYTAKDGSTEFFGDILCVRAEEWQYAVWEADEKDRYRYGKLSECIEWSLADAKFFESAQG